VEVEKVGAEQRGDKALISKDKDHDKKVLTEYNAEARRI
jgi:hypothetical protein